MILKSLVHVRRNAVLSKMWGIINSIIINQCSVIWPAVFMGIPVLLLLWMHVIRRYYEIIIIILLTTYSRMDHYSQSIANIPMSHYPWDLDVLERLWLIYSLKVKLLLLALHWLVLSISFGVLPPEFNFKSFRLIISHDSLN